MKKITILLFAAIFLSAAVFAGPLYKGKKGRGKSSGSMGYYGISVGLSLPMGDFASTAAIVPTAISPVVLINNFGGAKTGIHVNLANFGYKFSDNFGIAALIPVGGNKCNEKVVDPSFTNTSAWWTYGGILIGPLASFPASDQITIDFHPVVGLIMAVSPEIKDNDGTAVIKSASASGFGFDIGASCRFSMGGSTCLALNVDYLSAKPEFTAKEHSTTPGIDLPDIKYKQQISSLGISVGVAFGL